MDRYGVSAQLDEVEFLFRSNAYYAGFTVVSPCVSMALPDGASYSNVTLVRGHNRDQAVEDFRTNAETGRSHAVEGHFIDTRSVKQCVRNTSAGNGWNLFMTKRKMLSDAASTEPMASLPSSTVRRLAALAGPWIYERYEGEGTHEDLPDLGLVEMRLDRYATADGGVVVHAVSVRPCGGAVGTPWVHLMHSVWVYKCNSQ
jgi:hypothetical protein